MNCMSHCGDKRERGVLPRVECHTEEPDTWFYDFSGRACAELYTRQKDCFMSVIPVFVSFLFFWLLAGLAGLFLSTTLSLFSVAVVLLFSGAVAVDGIVTIKKRGLTLKGAIVFHKALYRSDRCGTGVPLSKKYGIYTDKIVADAARDRRKLLYAGCAMILSFALFLSLALTGVLS